MSTHSSQAPTPGADYLRSNVRPLDASVGESHMINLLAIIADDLAGLRSQVTNNNSADPDSPTTA